MSLSTVDYRFLHYLIVRDPGLLPRTRIGDVEYLAVDQLPFDVVWVAQRELPEDQFFHQKGDVFVECVAFWAWAKTNAHPLRRLIEARQKFTNQTPKIPEPVKAEADCKGHILSDPDALQKLIDNLESPFPKKGKGVSADDLRLQHLQRLLTANHRQLPLITDERLKALQAIGTDFPNFQTLTEALYRELRLGQVTGQSTGFRPILVVGKPGIGKTEYINRLAEALSMQYVLCSIASMSGGLYLKGTCRIWGNCNIGTVAESMIQLPQKKSALMLFDEVDKIQDHSKNMPIVPVLLELLEPSQSKRYRDEFLDISMDLSGCLHFIATANDPRTIPAPLMSRFRRFDIPEPTQAQMPSIIRSVDRSIRAQHANFDAVFLPLGDEVMAAVSALPPRSLRMVLEEAYGHALARGGDRGIEVTGADIRRGMRNMTSVKSDAKTEEDVTGYLVMKLTTNPSGGSSPPTTFH